MLAKTQKWLLWTGLILSTVYGLGFVLMGFFPPPSPSFGAEEVLKLYTANNMQFRIGVCLMLIGGGWNLPWTVVYAIQMAREEKGTPILAILQLAAGSLSTVLFFIPAVFWGVAAFSVERDPALTLMMHELGFLTFITPVSVFALQAIPLGVVCLMPKKDESLSPFPRWMAYLTFWTAITAEVGVTAQLFKAGPFAWNGIFPFYIPIIVFAAWLGGLFYLILRVVDRQQQAAN